jgi:hypothetical protein
MHEGYVRLARPEDLDRAPLGDGGQQGLLDRALQLFVVDVRIPGAPNQVLEAASAVRVAGQGRDQGGGFQVQIDGQYLQLAATEQHGDMRERG